MRYTAESRGATNAGRGAIVLWTPRREDVALSAGRRRSCRPVALTHDPLDIAIDPPFICAITTPLSAARVDVDVLPTNGPEIFPQTDWPPPEWDQQASQVGTPPSGIFAIRELAENAE